MSNQKHLHLGRSFLVVLAIVTALTLSACSFQVSVGSPAPVSSAAPASLAAPTMSYDEKTVVANAKEVADVLNTGDYAALFSLLREDVQKTTSVDGLKSVFAPIMEPAGKFVEYKGAQTSVATDEKFGTFVSVVLAAHYESKDLTVTVNLDKDSKLAGLSAK